MPPSPMGAAAAPPAASGVPVALIKEAVQAAMQREAEKQVEARKSDGEEDAKDKDEDGKPDAEKDLEKDLEKGLEKDNDRDGTPDADHEEKVEADEKDQPAAAADGVDGGRAPVHIEMDIDTEQLLTPMTVTLDRENPIGSPPASAT
jgi:hypothetical protein